MFCKNCGAKLRDGAVFCPECGTKVTTTEASKTTQPPQQDFAPVVTPEQPDATDVPSNNTSTNKSDKKKWIPFLLLIAVIIILLIIVLILATGKTKTDSSTQNNADAINTAENSTMPADSTVDNESFENDTDISVSNPNSETETTETEILETQEPEELQYILPTSDSEYLTMDDLEGLTAEECRIARNELYARHGRLFTDEALQAYFDSCDWYTGSIAPEDFDESILNEYEFANRDLIVTFEKEKGYR